MSEEDSDREDLGFSYDPVKDRGGPIKVNVKMEDKDYQKLKDEKEELEAQITAMSLQKFDDEIETLRRAGIPESELEQAQDSPYKLEYLKGRYHEKLQPQTSKPETPGQATMRTYDRNDLRNMAFESEKQMGEFLLRKSFEISKEGHPTEQAKQAKTMLRQLGKKLKLESLPRKIVVGPSDELMRAQGLTVIGKDETPSWAQYKKIISKEDQY